jgi:hypothetical protein
MTNIGNAFFENVAKLKYFVMTLTNQNCMYEEIKSSLNSGNACYQFVHNLLSSHMLSKNIGIKIYRSIILPVVLYACETWPLILSEERRLRAFSNRVLRNMVDLTREKVTGDGRDVHNKELQYF